MSTTTTTTVDARDGAVCGPAGPTHARDPASLLLEAVGVTTSYRRGMWPWRTDHPVLTGADLGLRAGEVVGLVGENGSKKPKFMQILVGEHQVRPAVRRSAGHFTPVLR